MPTDKPPFYFSLPFALCLCGMLLIVSMIPAVNAEIIRLDKSVFIHLNGLITKSSVFDHFLRFFVDSSHNFPFFMAALVITVILIAFSSDPRTIISRYATFLYIFAVLGITMLVEDQIDRFIERRSPSYSEIPFINIGEVYNWRDFDITDKKTFPSDEGLIFLTIGFMLLRLGYRKIALPVITLGLITPIGLCMVGITWLSDLYLGALPGAFLVAAMATQTRFAHLHDRLRQNLTVLVDQTRMTTHNLIHRFNVRTRLTNSNDAIAVENAVKQFVNRKIPQLMTGKSAEETADMIPEISMPVSGVRNIVRILRCDGKTAVLRVFPSHKLRDARRHKKATETLQANHITTPKILAYRETDENFNNVSFILEEFVSGTMPAPEEFSQDKVEILAEALARLHNVHATAWGSFEINRFEDCFSVYYRRAKRYLKNANLTFQQKHYIKSWLQSYEKDFKQITEYSLVHRDLRLGNGFFTEENQFCLIDNVTVQWGVPAGDIAMVYYYYFRFDPELIRAFSEKYFPLLKKEHAEIQLRLLPFYSLVLLLMELSRNSKFLNRKTKKTGNSKAEKKQDIILNVIERVLTEHPTEKKS